MSKPYTFKPLVDQRKTKEILSYYHLVTLKELQINVHLGLIEQLRQEYHLEKDVIYLDSLLRLRYATRKWIIQFITESNLVELSTEWEMKNRSTCPSKWIFAKREFDYNI